MLQTEVKVPMVVTCLEPHEVQVFNSLCEGCMSQKFHVWKLCQLAQLASCNVLVKAGLREPCHWQTQRRHLDSIAIR